MSAANLDVEKIEATVKRVYEMLGGAVVSAAENMRANPMAGMMYGSSVLRCVSSALSEPDGAGLGTLGFTEDVARTMTRDAGFTRFRTCDFDHPMNAHYEVRP